METKCKRYLDVVLTSAEIYDKQAELSDLMCELSSAEASMAEAKKTIKALEEARRVRTSALVRGTESRLVECTQKIDGYRVTVTRDDNGEIVESRQATTEERQLALPTAESGDDAEPRPDTVPPAAKKRGRKGAKR